MRPRTIALLLSAALSSLALLRGLVRLLTGGGHANRLVTRLWDLSFSFPIPYGLRLRVLRQLGYSFIVGALAVIRSDDGRYLLAHHTYPVGRTRDQVWALPGGAVEKYESIPEALRRELSQELGLDVAVDRLLLVDTSEAPRLDFVFACSIRNGQFRASSEVDAIDWFGPTELPAAASSRHRRLLDLLATQRDVTIFT